MSIVKTDAMFQQQRYRSVWISDVHLGSKDCKAEYIFEFLTSLKCDYLFLVGDIVDLCSMSRSMYWPQSHNNVLRAILGKAKHDTQVIYVPGNHDEPFRDHAGTAFGNLSVHERYIHTTADGRKLLVLHGDQFDGVIKCGRLLSFIGNRGYDLLMQLSRWIFHLRQKLGFSYWSLSKYLKTRVKNAVNHIRNYETAAAYEAKRSGLDGVVCGHIHHAEIREIDGVEYFNTGDWVENCTALVEHRDGKLELLHWSDRQQTVKVHGQESRTDLTAKVA